MAIEVSDLELAEELAELTAQVETMPREGTAPAATGPEPGTPGYREGRWAVSPYNFDERVRRDMHLPQTVQLMDMTLREGRQVAGVSVGLEEVLEFARRIDEVGIPIVEMHHDFIEEIKRVKAMGVRFRIQALVHPTAALNPEACREEIDLCLDAGADIICPAFAISDYNFGLVESMGGLTISREEALDRACEAVQYGKEQGAFVNPNLMDFSRLDLEWLKVIVTRLKEAGIDMLRIDDICGACIPAVYKHHAWEVKQILGPDLPLAIHSHEDFQLGTAGQLAALEGGAEVLEGTINGLGERAGVPNLAVLASVLEMMYGYETGVRLELLQELSEWVADVWNQPIPPHAAGVGKTAFSHAAEVHYALPEGDEWSFNAWSPKVIGNGAYVPLCHYSGQKAVQRKVVEQGLEPIDDDTADRVLERVRFEVRMRRREPSDELFQKIVREERGREPRPHPRRAPTRTTPEREPMGDLSGKNVILTGASRGIGREIARGLAREGATVALMARTEGALKELADELADTDGGGIAIPGDVSDPQQVKRMVERARQELGRIDALVNSAGVLDNEGIAGHSDETWRWHFSVNVDSYFFLIREVIGEMFERRDGRVVNIASTSSKVAIGPNRAAYVASKHAVNGLTREVAVEAAPYNVMVNAVAPGFVLTDMVEDSMRKFARDFGTTPEATRAEFTKKIPLGRFIDPVEVVPLVLFLLSDGAGAITGQTISVDGGFAPL